MTQRWYFDTEFDDDGRTIDLISIGIVGVMPSGEKKSYYAVSREFDENKCNDWVKTNVFPKLPSRDTWKSRAAIAGEILQFINRNSPKLPRDRRGVEWLDIEFWGYFADYDWVVLCQLFGPMVNLPTGWPQFAHDLRQVMGEHHIRKSMLPPLPENVAHDALVDAEWTRDAHQKALTIIEERRRVAEDERRNADDESECT